MRPGDRIDEDTIAIYFEALAGPSIERVEAAIKRHIVDPERGRFFPAVADIMAQLQALDAQARVPGPAATRDRLRALEHAPAQPEALGDEGRAALVSGLRDKLRRRSVDPRLK